MMRLLIVTLLLCFGLSANAQTDLYVDSSVSASGNGNSWSTAFKTLGEALETANAANTSSKFVVNVAQGTYFPGGASSNSSRDSAFCIFRGGVKVFGGFPSGGGTRDVDANPTILSGNIGSSALNDNSYHIMVISNINAASDSIVLNGLTFTGGYGNQSTSRLYNSLSVANNSGGGIAIINVAANCLISGCIFSGNLVNLSGGAVDIYQGRTTFYSCVFDDNSAYSNVYTSGEGGAIRAGSATEPVNIIKCVFRRSWATYDGGAVAILSNTLNTIDSCEFTNNTAGSLGGGIYCATVGSNPSGTVVSNCTFTSNNTSGFAYSGLGGALFGTVSIVRDCSFSQNYARNEGGALYTDSPVRRCSFDGNTTNGQGGAARLKKVDSCLFTNNRAGTFGGALTMSTGTTTTNGCQFYGNLAGTAGGALYVNQTALVGNCTIGKNSAPNGGGIFVDNGTFTLQNSIISGNTATSNGGGLYSKRMNFTASSCLFSGNLAKGNGGAIYDSSANPTLTNCTLAGDTAKAGNAIYNNNGLPFLRNCIVWDGANCITNVNGSAPSVQYSIVQGGYSGTGNSSSDPLFINPLPASSVPDTGGIYEIQHCSPASNSGSNSGSYAGLKDLSGKPRLFGTTVDRGAYEIQLSYPLPISGNAGACPYDTIRLSVPVSGGSWVSSNPAIAAIDTNGILTGLATGNVAISYNIGTGACQNVASRVIVVYPLPKIASITGKTAVCPNDTLQLRDSTSGGTWFQQQASIGTVNANGVYRAAASGKDTVRYTTINTFGCRDTVSHVITVDSLPNVDPISGPGSACGHDTVTFSNTTPGGVWTNDFTSSLSISSTGVYITPGQGIDTIRYTVRSAAGCRNQAKMAFIMHPFAAVPNIYGPTIICIDGHPALSSNAPGGIWGSLDTNIVTIDANGRLSAKKVGGTRVTYTYVNSNGCSGSSSDTLSVMKIDTSVKVEGHELTANISGGTFRWLDCDNGNTPIPGELDRTFIATRDGRYAVEISDWDCVDTSACFEIRGLGISGAARYNQGITIVPNPASVSATIRLLNPGSYVFSLRDPSGKVLSQQTFTGSELKIDLNEYASGVYFIEMISGTERLTRKLQILR